MDNMKISALMNSDVVTSKPGETLSRVLSKMSNDSLHETPVIDDKKRTLLGYFSFQTLSKKKHVSPNTRIERLMVSSPKIGAQESIFSAAGLMLETGFRAIPVVKGDDTLAGIISRTDILDVVPSLDYISRLKAEEIMTLDPKVLSPIDNIEAAINLMEELGEPSAPVVDENQRISGSVLIDDIWRSIWYNREGEDKGEFVGEKEKLKIEVKAFVSPIAVAKKDELLTDICSSMTRFNPYICAVVDEHQMPIGVITQYDILKRLVKYESERGVFLDITGFEIKDPFLYSSMITKLERFIEKAGKYSWLVPYKLSLDVGGQNKGGRTSWNLRARLNTDLAQLNVKSRGWDLLTCVDEIVEELNRRIIDIKPEYTV